MSSKPTCQPTSALVQTARPMTTRREEHRREHEEDNFDEAAQLARSAYRIALSLKDMVNTEYKRFRVDQAATGLSSSGSILATVNIPSQGDDNNMRIGDSIKVQSLTLRWQHRLPASVSWGKMRIIVFWDESNVTSAYGNLMEIGANPLGTLYPKNYDRRFLTKILYEKESVIHPNFTTGGMMSRTFEKHIKIDLHTQFQAATNTIVTGALKIAALGVSPGGVVGDNIIDFVSYVTFTDN